MGNKYDLAIKYINTESCGKTVRGSGAGGGGSGGGGGLGGGKPNAAPNCKYMFGLHRFPHL